MNEFVIKNAYLIDGSGSPGRVADAAISNDRITHVGQNLPVNSKVEIIDGSGLTLCPGFIDAHGHSDMSLLAAPEATGKISQGITTEIIGNCGLSAFPVTTLNREHLEELYSNYNQPITWNSLNEYAAEFERRTPAINVASLCGHNTLRASIAGYEKQRLDEHEQQEMDRVLHENLTAGAAGLSSGLLYVPGRFSDENEIVRLLKVINAFNRQYTTHLRSEGKFLLESLAETIGSAAQAGLSKLHISHLKTAGKSNWHKLDEAFNLIETARQGGLQVTADRYPYIESMTSLSIILPSPYDDRDDSTLKNWLAAPDNATKILQKLEEYPSERWQTARLVSTAEPILRNYCGKTFAEIAEAKKIQPAQLCLEILKHDATGAMAAFAGMNRENMVRILARPYTFMGTDESARPLDYSIGTSHPRGFGSVPEFIRCLSGIMPLEQIISKITSLPAQAFGLKQRGLITPGYYADMVLFDPSEFAAKADFNNPHGVSDGVRQVWVNGIPAGKKRGGKFILFKTGK